MRQGRQGISEREPRSRVLVVDDDPGLRSLLVSVLGAAGLDVVEANDGGRAVAAVDEERPELVILDVDLPGLSGYEVCHQLRAKFATLPILLLSGERVESYDRVAGLLLGADDFMQKPFATDELLARARRMIKTAAPRDTPLTARETEVLSLLAQGATHKAIAQELFIAPKTAAKHIERILSKLGLHSRASAVAWAFEHGLVSPRANGGSESVRQAQG
jgi:DNA-binding NarL/FixJ family response regulator